MKTPASPLVSSRRTFIKTLSAGAAGAGLSPRLTAAAYSRVSGANARLSVGMIGIGRMGRGHLNTLLNLGEEADVVALCDVYQPNLDWAHARAPGAETFKDFRDLLNKPGLDAVVIASPDHWHALHTIHACRAGKDVYVEKPSCLAIKEGRKMVDAVRTNDRIVQVGTQQRSARHFQEAVEIVRSGVLGPVSLVRAWNSGNEFPDGIGNPANSASPPGLDWDLWLGPAPRRPFNANRFGVMQDEKGDYTRWASFRWFWDYAGGMMTDWGVHLLDIVQWAMAVDYPERISSTGGKFYLQDNRETPDTIVTSYHYPGFMCTYENRSCNSLPLNGHGYGILFHGTAGTLFVDRAGFELMPERGSDGQPRQQARYEGERSHMQGFFDSIRTREQPICDIEIGHRSSSTAILGNIAYRTGRHLTWDGAREDILDDPQAARLLDVAYRAPWVI